MTHPDGRSLWLRLPIVAAAIAGAALPLNGCDSGDGAGGRSAGKTKSGHATTSVAQAPATAERPAVALARRWIAYVVGGRRGSQLYVGRADGTDARRVTRGSGFHYDPDWSANGKRLLFRFEPPAATVQSRSYVMLVRPDGSGLVNRSKRLAIGASAGSWAPDGRIAFGGARFGDPGGNGVYVVNVDQTEARRISPSDAEAQYPAWSPDGRTIAFVLVRGGEADIYLAAPDGSHLRQLTRGPGFDGAPIWSPDSKRVVYVRDEQMRVVNADGSGDRPLTGINRTRCGFPGNWAPSDLLALNCPKGAAAMTLDGTGFTKLLPGRHRIAGFIAWRP